MRDSIDSKLVTRFSEWLLKYIPEFRYQTKEPRIAEIGGDAGFRRYYRVNSQPTRIGVISPPEKEKPCAHPDARTQPGVPPAEGATGADG